MQVSAVATALEERFRPLIEAGDYDGGIGQFVVLFVSVETDPLENERYCIANNCVSRYKDFVTGAFVRYISIAIPVDPGLVLQSSNDHLTDIFMEKLLAELADPAFAMPKKFNRLQLLADFQRP